MRPPRFIPLILLLLGAALCFSACVSPSAAPANGAATIVSAVSSSSHERVLPLSEHHSVLAQKISLPDNLMPLYFLSDTKFYATEKDSRKSLLLYDCSSMKSQQITKCLGELTELDFWGGSLVFDEGIWRRKPLPIEGERWIAEKIAVNDNWLVWLEYGNYLDETFMGIDPALLSYSTPGPNEERVACWLRARNLQTSEISEIMRMESRSNGQRYLAIEDFCLDQNQLFIIATPLGQSATLWKIDLTSGEKERMRTAYELHGLTVTPDYLVLSMPSGLAFYDRAGNTSNDFFWRVMAEEDPSALFSTQDRRRTFAISYPAYGAGVLAAVYAPCDSNGVYGFETEIVEMIVDTMEISPLIAHNSPIYWEDIARSAAEGSRRQWAENRAVQRSKPLIGSRFLSWQSNFPDKRYLYDLQEHCFVEIELDFMENTTSLAERYTIQHLPSASDDYFYISLFSQAEPGYILRLSSR